jgi:hypothetical protein
MVMAAAAIPAAPAPKTFLRSRFTFPVMEGLFPFAVKEMAFSGQTS